MKIALFIPCYIDQFYPQVGVATLQLLQRLGCDIHYPPAQTCCGQPMANTGCESDAQATYAHFARVFQGHDYVVAPSASCVYHVRKHYDIIAQTPEVQHLRERTLDLSEFLLDILEVRELDARFPHRVGLHRSCHGLRGLRLGYSSERYERGEGYQERLLQLIDGLELVPLDRSDECCGFGGTFAISQPHISTKMGKDRIADHERHGAEVITAGDMSCLMHLEGLIRRRGSGPRILHIAEILNGTTI